MSTSYDYNILLADDDLDDCLIFRQALEESNLSFELATVHNGDSLILLLNQSIDKLPDILFLDLNMPRKNGFECLSEIKANAKLKQLPVIIYSTFINSGVIDLLYKVGAQHLIQKPSDFAVLGVLLKHAILETAKAGFMQPVKSNFLLSE